MSPTDRKLSYYDDGLSTARKLLDEAISTMDFDAQQTMALSMISGLLRDLPFYADKYASSVRSVPASEPEHSHVGPNL